MLDEKRDQRSGAETPDEGFPSQNVSHFRVVVFSLSDFFGPQGPINSRKYESSLLICPWKQSSRRWGWHNLLADSFPQLQHDTSGVIQTTRTSCSTTHRSRRRWTFPLNPTTDTSAHCSGGQNNNMASGLDVLKAVFKVEKSFLLLLKMHLKQMWFKKNIVLT